MFNIDSIFNVVFYIVALSLLALFLFTFILLVAIKKQKRGVGHSFLSATYGILLIILGVVTLAFLAGCYPTRVLALVNSGGTLILNCFGEQFFTLAKAGNVVDEVVALSVMGYAVPAFLSLFAIVNLALIKARSVKKPKGEKVVAQNIESMAAETTEPLKIESQPALKLEPIKLEPRQEPVKGKPVTETPIIETHIIEEPIIEKSVVKKSIIEMPIVVQPEVVVVAEKTIIAVHQPTNYPVSKKYIILNRNNAANVFNEYLKAKNEAAKTELSNNINTIIVK